MSFFAKHDLEFPPAIRTLIGELRRVMMFKDVNLLFDGQEILARSGAVSETVNKIKKHVGELVGRRR